MTQQEIASEYKVDANGIIRSPGKFEGEPSYAVHYYDVMMNGFADATIGGEGDTTDLFSVSDDDRKEFPDLCDAKTVVLTYSDNGFVYSETRNEDVATVEAELQGDDEPQEGDQT